MRDYSSIESPAGLRFASCQLHGVLVQVFGSGVLLTGDSGVGKTACAIELLRRGHALVADDAVQIFQRGADLVGRAPVITRSLVHIRGIGIANVTDVFHRATILNECRIDICIEIDGSNNKPPAASFGGPFFRIGTASAAVTADRIEFITRDYFGSEMP